MPTSIPAVIEVLVDSGHDFLSILLLTGGAGAGVPSAVRFPLPHATLSWTDGWFGPARGN